MIKSELNEEPPTKKMKMDQSKSRVWSHDF